MYFIYSTRQTRSTRVQRGYKHKKILEELWNIKSSVFVTLLNHSLNLVVLEEVLGKNKNKSPYMYIILVIIMVYNIYILSLSSPVCGEVKRSDVSTYWYFMGFE